MSLLKKCRCFKIARKGLFSPCLPPLCLETFTCFPCSYNSSWYHCRLLGCTLRWLHSAVDTVVHTSIHEGPRRIYFFYLRSMNYTSRFILENTASQLSSAGGGYWFAASEWKRIVHRCMRNGGLFRGTFLICMYNMLVIFWKWSGVWSQVQCPPLGTTILFFCRPLK